MQSFGVRTTDGIDFQSAMPQWWLCCERNGCRVSIVEKVKSEGKAIHRSDKRERLR